MLRKTCIAIAAILSFAQLNAQQETTAISVDAAHPGAAISPTLFGIFFEDINFAADGGLYPERIKNRSFEFDQGSPDGTRCCRSPPRASWARRKAKFPYGPTARLASRIRTISASAPMSRAMAFTTRVTAASGLRAASNIASRLTCALQGRRPSAPRSPTKAAANSAIVADCC